MFVTFLRRFLDGMSAQPTHLKTWRTFVNTVEFFCYEIFLDFFCKFLMKREQPLTSLLQWAKLVPFLHAAYHEFVDNL